MVGTLVAALLFAASLTPAQSFPDLGKPIADEAYIEDLVESGYMNGRLGDDTLLPIDDSGSCLLEEEAAEAWLRLEIHAANAGIDLVARWCYRDLATQTRTYRRNCPRTVTIVEPATNPDAEDEAAVVTRKGPRVCSPPTAKPGNSNHGWGRAADIKSDGRLLTCGSEAFEWLQDHAHLYGWVHPGWAACGETKQEPWHWEWGATQEPAPPVTQLRSFTA